MPTYVYKFVDTGETVEVQQSFKDDTLSEFAHPESGLVMPVKKVFQPVGVSFKGSGFFKNDNRAKSSKTSDGSSTESSKSESSSSSESKSSGSDSGTSSDSKSSSDSSSTQKSSSDSTTTSSTSKPSSSKSSSSKD